MANNLEQVVRPFQSPSNFRNALPAAGAVDDPKEVVVLVFGQEGADIKSLSGSFSANTTYYCDQKAKEFEREVHTKKITNPDDESQFVNVEVIDKITDKTGSGPQYQKKKFTLKNTDD